MSDHESLRHRLWRMRRGRWTRRRPRVTAYGGPHPPVLQCAIAYNRYGGYRVPLSSRHRPAAQAVLAGKVWEPDRSGPGRMPFRMLDERGVALGGESRLVAAGESGGDCAMVEVVALDDVLPAGSNIAVMQLDVEGSEQSALEGALKTIHRGRPALVLERLPNEAWLVENIFSLGYQPVDRVHENTVLEVL